ncbi:hypothetical protein CBS101457_003001 [Exobasidium rhododendri]|nr:hypothetical protein CBS101457_003001 [Exobasidium rhododendri]
MSSDGVATNKVPLLTGDNYFEWKSRVSTIIKAKSFKAFSIINGSYLFPVNPNPSVTTSTRSTNQLDQDYQEELEQWHTADANAQKIIQEGISSATFSMISNLPTALAQWTELNLLYGQVQLSERLRLQTQFDQLSQGSQSTEDFINTVISMQSRLASIGFPPEPDRVIQVLLWNLNSKFDQWQPSLQTSIDEWSLNGISYAAIILKVISKIKSADKLIQIRMERTKGIGREVAMSSQHQTGSNRPNCSFCKRVGHTAERCFKNPKGQSYRPSFQDNSKAPYQKKEANRHHRPSNQDNRNNRKDHASIASEVEEHAAVSAPSIESHWMVDSGASSHVTSTLEDFITLTKADIGFITVGGKRQLPIKGIGEVLLQANLDGKLVPRRLINVYYVPDLGFRLYSTEKSVLNGFRPVYADDGTLTIRSIKNNFRLFNTVTLNGARYLDCITPVHEQALITTKPVSKDLSLWHQRLGHIAEQAVKHTLNQGGVKKVVDQDGEVCSSCLQGGHVRHSFSPRHTKSSEPLALVHSDVVGPLPPSLKHNRYFCTFVDDATGFLIAYTMKGKDSTFQSFKQFLPLAERAAAKPLRILRSDGGGEYVNAEMQQFLADHGIPHQITIARTPQQNGVAERLNRTLMEMTRAMLIKSNCPEFLWAEAFTLAVWIHNRVARRGAKSPYHRWYKQQPDLNLLRTFGCLAYAANTSAHKKKLEHRSEVYIFIGFSEGRKGWKLYSISSRTITNSIDVVFEENNFPYLTNGDVPPSQSPSRLASQVYPNLDTVIQNLPYHQSLTPSSDPALITASQEPEADPLDDGSSLSSLSSEEEDTPVPLQRQRKPPSYLRDFQHFAFLANALIVSNQEEPVEPTTVNEAQKLPDWPLWEEAVKGELNNHKVNGTWKLVDLPYQRWPITARWVLTRKFNADGSINKYKARLVARGYSQREGLDFKETFAPVIRIGTIRLVLAIATKNHWKVHQMDVVAAYLNGNLEEEIYMVQPPGMEDGTGRVCRLIKGLYGLKQAGRVWYQKAHKHLMDIGFKCLDADQGLYFRKQPSSAIVCLYVDDILITAASVEEIITIKEEFHRAFKMTDGGLVSFILGLQVSWNNSTVTISQETYVKKIVKRFNLESANAVSTPLPSGFCITTADSESPLTPSQHKLYQSAVGAIMYAAMGTRVDIAFSAQLLSRRLNAPTSAHWAAVKHLLRYLKGTANYHLSYIIGVSPVSNLNVYCDADYAGDKETSRSTTGMISTFNSGIVTWASRRQTTVAQSTLESEYIALCEATKETIWLRTILAELGELQEGPTTIHADNLGANAFTKETQFHRRTKHIAVKYHYTRDMVTEGNIIVEYIPTSLQKADILTKGLPRVKHSEAIAHLSMSNT